MYAVKSLPKPLQQAEKKQNSADAFNPPPGTVREARWEAAPPASKPQGHQQPKAQQLQSPAPPSQAEQASPVILGTISKHNWQSLVSISFSRATSTKKSTVWLQKEKVW